uniref:Col_cuticle_N domain-containing protein n=1 Tax=Caenorhabditis tropicalis TaxID=1561998 RepID=A0A1I7UBT3_9PELO
MAKTLVTIASIGSGVAVLACLFTVGYIFNDINSFYDDVIDTMTEFKFNEQQAWNSMMKPTDVFGRIKRGINKRNAQCNYKAETFE